MNKKKYQVFLSSTYQDLMEERKQVLDVLLMADCIPAGMESFVATDDEQFAVIKKVIDLCDYYILIIGKRYGSINEVSGISYTEMEYDYAIEKGIPVLVFALDDSVNLSEDKIEKDSIKNGKLAEFKQKAMKNRLASVFRSTSELTGQVAIAIMEAKTEIQRPGWRRGNQGEDSEELLRQILFLKEENEELKEKVQSNNMADANFDLPDSFYKNEIEILYLLNPETEIIGSMRMKQTIKTTLSEQFKAISLGFIGIIRFKSFLNLASSFVDGYDIDPQSALKLINAFEQFNLIEREMVEDGFERMNLTDLGKEIRDKLNNDWVQF